MRGTNRGPANDTSNNSLPVRASLPRSCKDDQTCHFFDLPAELRNVVYELALTVDTEDVIRLIQRPNTHKSHTMTESVWSFDRWVEKKTTHGPTVLNLLAVNKQIRTEAIKIFPDVNHFLIGLHQDKANPDAEIMSSLQFMKQIDARTLGGFRRITLDINDGATTLEAATLACKRFVDLPRLQTLKVVAYMGDAGGPGSRTYHWEMAMREKDFLKRALSKLKALEVFELEFEHYGVVARPSKEQLDGLVAELRAALPKEKEKKRPLKLAKPQDAENNA